MTCNATKMAHLIGIICAAALGKQLLDIPEDKSGMVLHEDEERGVVRMAYTILEEVVPKYYRGLHFVFMIDMINVTQSAKADGYDEIAAIDEFIDACLTADKPILGRLTQKQAA